MQEVKGSAVAKRGSLEFCVECWRSDSISHSHALLTASSLFIYLFFFFFMCMVQKQWCILAPKMSQLQHWGFVWTVLSSGGWNGISFLKNRKRATVSITWTVCLCWLWIGLYFSGWSRVCNICPQTLHRSVFDLCCQFLCLLISVLILIISKYLFLKIVLARLQLISFLLETIVLQFLFPGWKMFFVH